MTKEEAIKDIEENILPFVGGKSLRMAIDALRQPERKTGQWTLLPNGNALCSECGYMQVHVWDLEDWDNYCHHCGADMRCRYEEGGNE